MYSNVRAIFIALLCLWTAPALADTTDDNVWLVELDGPVGPASVDLIVRTIADANEADIDAVIIRMNTPGGLDKAMRDLIQTILASQVPIITYVAPNGARAASAGTYIAYASHIAAMAPATNIGSSTPVSIAPQGLPATPGSEDDDPPGGSAAKPLDTMSKKIINDAVAYLQSLAELRQRNLQWAEATVREGANLRASAALEANVIDLIADDVPSLLEAIHGRSVAVASGDHTLNTASASVRYIESDWRHDLLEVLTDPSIAYGLLIIGMYALMLEFYNPGLILPAMTGVILILLGAYGLQLLPVNYAGLALVVLGLMLMIAEVITPTFGVLGVGGLVAFVMGSLIMFDTEVPGYTLPLTIIAGFTAATGLTVFFIVGMAIKARRQPVVTGIEAMLGASGVAATSFAEVDGHFQGDVMAFGEMWQAHSEQPLEKDTPVRIEAINGLVLDVSKEN
jgi:membrane-bound serine protease (ClpP class)